MMSEKRKEEIRAMLVTCFAQKNAEHSWSVVAANDLMNELDETVKRLQDCGGALLFCNEEIERLKRLVASKDQEIRARDRLITKSISSKLVTGKRTTR